MKTSILLKILHAVLFALLGILITGAILLFASCETAKHTSSDTSVFIDVTEPLLAWPQSDEILALSGVQSDQMNGAELHISLMSDVSFNKENVFSLPKGGNDLTTNQFTRKREVEQYEKSIANFFDSLSVDTAIGRQKSSLYLPMVRELDRLSKSKAEKRMLIVYSDLMENDNDFSFYHPQTFALLRTNPDNIKSVLLAKMPLADYSGIVVYFIYQPKNAQDDDAFRLVYGFYKTLFEQHGANLIIGANLTH